MHEELTGIIEPPLKISNLYSGIYSSPNEQNQMCELCMFSQSHIATDYEVK